MNTANLRAFMRVVERRSVSAAAEDLAITQAGVSMLIRRLERFYHTPLIQRRNGSIEPTVDGEALYVYASEVCQAEERLAAKLVATRERGEALLRIGTTRTIAPHLLLPLLPRFKRSHPGVRVTIETASIDVLVSRVLEGELDFAFMRSYGHPDLTNELVRREPVIFVAPPSDPLTRRSRVSADEILRHPFVVLNASSGLRRRLEQALDCAHRGPLEVAVEVAHVEALKEALGYGLGCAWIYAALVGEELRRGLLREVHVEGVELASEFYLVRRTKPGLNAAAAALCAIIREVGAQKPS